MFVINCPYCGEREQSEFKAGGEAHIVRPKQPTELSDDQWAEYLFMRKNIKGIQYESWNHAHGCRKWFNMIRDCLLYTSPSPRDVEESRMPSSA